MPTEPSPEWKVLGSREIYSSPPWVTLSLQHIRLPNGKEVQGYHHIKLPEYTVIFAETAEGKVLAERQYKHGAGRVSITLPAGIIEPGEPPLAAAQRELLEETGYAAEHWESLGSYHLNGNYGCGKGHIFRARNARLVAAANSGDLEEMEILQLSKEDLLQAVRDGDIAFMSAMAAICLATHPAFAAGLQQA